MRFLLSLLIWGFLTFNALAIGVDKDQLEDPVKEAHAQKIMKQLRCLVCQNQSITDSDAGLAGDLRAIVREQVKEGKSEKEILHFMTSRYGDWVLLKPPVKASTALLWFGPFVLLLIGGGLVWRYVRRKPARAALDPLSPEEETRLKRILAEDDT